MFQKSRLRKASESSLTRSSIPSPVLELMKTTPAGIKASPSDLE